MSEISHKQIAELFKILMHPERIAILEMLRNGERCVCEIEGALQQRQAYISQQLSQLRNAGLVTSRRDGWRVFYRIITPEIFGIIDIAQALVNRAMANPNLALAATQTIERDAISA